MTRIGGKTMLFGYFRWKRMARKAIADNKTAKCIMCDDPIIPSDFVGVTSNQELVHAGYHFTLSEKSAFCETGAIGTGYWSGEEVVTIGESLASKAMRTGGVQTSSY